MPDAIDEKLKELIETGSTHDEDDKSYADMSIAEEMKADATGIQSRYVFICRGCGKAVVTQNKYHAADNWAQEEARLEIRGVWDWVSFHVLGQIPIIGSYLRDRAWRKRNATEDAISGQKRSQAQYRAFEEVKGVFQKCQKCGNWACADCYRDALCGTCFQVDQAQKQAAALQAQAQSQMGPPTSGA